MGSVAETDSDQKVGQLLAVAYVKEIPSVGKEKPTSHNVHVPLTFYKKTFFLLQKWMLATYM